MGLATTISLLQFKTSLLSLMYSAVSLSGTTPAISLSISVLHPLSVVSSLVLEGVPAALLGHHGLHFRGELFEHTREQGQGVGFVDGQHLSHGIIQKLRKLWSNRGVKAQCGMDMRVEARLSFAPLLTERVGSCPSRTPWQWPSSRGRWRKG
ncbi:hypothetical protein AMTR_s00075p00191470 [Amborella trichopoda]|uniref:Uncharacterized protein n=1 Tax=Amborella trichopoda TaxID=13333 RepID=W1P413_AMBTC|nr:hypothetical protein AMTR_s00075p00191470 [Amborella trichopoda]